MTAATFRARQRFEANDPAGVDQLLTDDDYDAFRDDALAALSALFPFTVTSGVTVSAGVRTIPLPDDFLTMDGGEADPYDGESIYRLVDEDGGVYTSDPDDQDILVDAANIILQTAPLTSGNWTLTFGGIWSIEDLPKNLIQGALDYATARYYDRRATEAAEYFKYDDGIESVDKKNVHEQWVILRDARLKRWQEFAAKVSPRSTVIGTTRWYRS